jgi:predicted nucleotidyltransferase
MESGGGSPLKELAKAAGRDFPHLFDARERTVDGLTARRASLARLRHDPDASIVLMGSWGRGEVTAGSDDDFMVLVDGAERPKVEVEPTIEEVSEVLETRPSEDGPFAEPVFSENLVNDIGLDADSNKNLTRRLLLLLESKPVSGDQDIYGSVRSKVLSRYLDESVKPYHPPRFLLNDVVRYWRTICVDFAA